MGKKGPVGKALRLLWGTACLAVLLITIQNQSASAGHSGVFFAATMMALTFPVYIFVTGILGAALWMVYESTGYFFPNHWGVTTAYWAVLVVAGYLQWFELVPQLLERRAPSSTPLGLSEKR
jgi:hypothetical protein